MGVSTSDGNTIGSFKITEVLTESDSEQSEEEHQINEDTESKSAVCLLARTTTCVFTPVDMLYAALVVANGLKS